MSVELTRKLFFSLLALSLILANGCSTSYRAISTPQTDKGLKDYYKKYFPIGVAVSIADLYGLDSALNNGSMIIRKAYPLLFDESLQRKKAYQAVVDF